MRAMKDDEIGLTFFTEGRPRSPEGMPSVFGTIDQAEILARIDEVQDDDLASSFFGDSLVEVENAATKVFDVGLRTRPDTAVEPASVGGSVAEVMPEPVTQAVAPLEPVVVERTVVEHRVVEETVVENVADHSIVEETRVEETHVEETVVVSTVEQVAEPDPGIAPAQRAETSPRLGAARADTVGLPTRTVITVPGILAKSADARRSFILGGPAAVEESE